jgi:GNAT superfamily N-acetyltransferase
VSDRTGAILRKLRAIDIPSAMQLSVEAGWNQTSEDWRTLIELAPEGCLAIEIDGELASTTTLVSYGRRLAWIGMVLTRMSYRGRGFARRLLVEALELAKQMGIETVKLDATDQGRPLYEKLDFRSEQPVERWEGPALRKAPSTTDLSDNCPQQNWQARDPSAFGVDRSTLLEKLARRKPPLSIGCSYLLTRPGRLTGYLGPCLAQAPATARSLMERALENASPSGWSWDLIPSNTNAVAIARDLGFTRKRRLMRMVRGKDLHTEEQLIYALAGFELG